MAIRKLYSKDIKVDTKLLGIIGDYAGPSDMYYNKLVKRNLISDDKSDWEVTAAYRGFTDGMATILGLSIEKIVELKKQIE